MRVRAPTRTPWPMRTPSSTWQSTFRNDSVPISHGPSKWHLGQTPLLRAIFTPIDRRTGDLTREGRSGLAWIQFNTRKR